MLNSTEKHLQCLAWYSHHKDNFSESRLKNQKFLFFYEMFSRNNDEEYTLDYLRAYANGPIFSNVYGDMRYRETELRNKIDEITDYNKINKGIAAASLYLVETFTEIELSKLTHNFDLWEIKEDRINQGEQNIPIYEDDISKKDDLNFKLLYKRYKNLADNEYKTISMLNKIFIISKEDYRNLTNEHDQIIEQLSQLDELQNPIYLKLDGEVLIID